MITTNALQVITRFILVECRCSQIEHAVVKRLVLKDMVNGRRFRHRFLTNGLRHKHLIVEITLIDLPHVDKTKHGKRSDHPLHLHLTVAIEQQTSRTDDDNPERAPAISSKYRHTHLCQVADQRCQLVGRNLLHGLHLVIADEIREEGLWHQGKQQADTSRQCKRSI